MLTLYTFGPFFGLPDPSPFVMKADMLLKLSGLEYSTKQGDVRKAPKQKYPVLVDGNTTIPDSTFIQMHLEQAHNIDFYPHCDESSKAIGWACDKMFEDSLYQIIVSTRWEDDDNFNKGPRQFFDDIPKLMRPMIIHLVRKKVARDLWGHGMSRHSKQEQTALSARIIQSASHILGDKPYLLGEHPSASDATAFGFLASALCPFFDSHLPDQVSQYANLTDYHQRMMSTYYPSNA